MWQLNLTENGCLAVVRIGKGVNYKQNMMFTIY